MTLRSEFQLLGSRFISTSVSSPPSSTLGKNPVLTFSGGLIDTRGEEWPQAPFSCRLLIEKPEAAGRALSCNRDPHFTSQRPNWKFHCESDPVNRFSYSRSFEIQAVLLAGGQMLQLSNRREFSPECHSVGSPQLRQCPKINILTLKIISRNIYES